MSGDGYPERLLATFTAELEEQVRELNVELLALEARPGDSARLRAVFRIMHTLKSAASAASVPLVPDVCHALETRLAAVRAGKATLDPSQFVGFFAAADALGDAARRLRAGSGLQGSPLEELALQLRKRRGQPRGAESGVRADVPPAGTETPATPEAEHSPAAGAGPAREGRTTRDDHVRVQVEKLDELLALTGQLLIAEERVRDRAMRVEALQEFAQQWAVEWRRQSRRVRRGLARSGLPQPVVRSLDAVDQRLRQLVHDAGQLAASETASARALTKVTEGMADQVRRIRMRPFTDACEPLARAVRDLAAASRKDVRLTVTGTEVEADRGVLDALREALLHLVRNAVDHGIEPAAVRTERRKPVAGTITVAAAVRGDRLLVTVADDGTGIDVASVRAVLGRRGEVVPAEDHAVLRVLFAGGLSTRAQATTVSGRGVGLDAVRSAMERVHGTVDVSTSAGVGTVFTLECPLTLAVVHSLLFRVGDQLLAVPTASVERLVRVREGEIGRAEGHDVIGVRGVGAPVPLIPLARLLGPPFAEPVADGPVNAIVLLSGDRRLAVSVDELLAGQELVVRPIDRSRRALPHLGGAAILSSGRVALLLNPPALVEAGLAVPGGTPAVVERDRPAAARRRILVVDDSITTRTLEQSILEAAGYDVLTAVDGADGWRVLQEQGADLVLADVEMPRMDGFALCAAIRGSKRFRELPVMLVTALESAEDRARGLEVGADAYLGKSSFDQESLLDMIHQLLG